MKRNILTLVVLLLSVSAMAQIEIDNAYRWYAIAHLNGNWSSSEDTRYMNFTKSLGFGADARIGYNFNDSWGFYAQFAWNNNKAGTHGAANPDLKKDFKFATFEPSVSITYNLTNGLYGFMPGRVHNIYFHIGPTVALRGKLSNYPDVNQWYNGEDIMNAREKSAACLGCSFGINYTYNFNNWVALSADVTGNIFNDNLNGRKDKGVTVDSRINLGVGVLFYLNKPTGASSVPVYKDNYVVAYDTLRVKEQKTVEEVNIFPVFYGVDSNTITFEQSKVIKQVADKLTQYPNRIVYVIGYADRSSDTKADLLTLAKDRANAVSSILVNNYGIDPKRIVAHESSAVSPYLNKSSNNRSTICIVTDLKHK